MKTLVVLALLAVWGIPHSHGLHENEIATEYISMDDYLEQVTASVDTELDANSMLGHKPPNRWYYSADPQGEIKDEIKERLVAGGLALVLKSHFNYLLRTRMKLTKLINLYPEHYDLWPLRIRENNSSSYDNEEMQMVGWKQPEWMDEIFYELAESRAELEELFED